MIERRVLDGDEVRTVRAHEMGDLLWTRRAYATQVDTLRIVRAMPVQFGISRWSLAHGFRGIRTLARAG